MHWDSLERRRLLSANLVADAGGINPTDSVALGAYDYFAASDGVHGKELWRSDGTTGGTRMVKDLLRGGASSMPQGFFVVGGKLYFTTSSDRAGTALWGSDGTAAGTVKVADLPDVMNASQLSAVGNTLIFTTQTDDTFSIWSSDGTTAGTSVVGIEDKPAQSRGEFAPQLIQTPGHVLIFTNNALWATDGTAAGTLSLYTTSQNAALPQFLLTPPMNLAGSFTFVAEREIGSTSQLELWRTDGTIAGTTRYAVIPGGGSGQDTVAGGKLYFLSSNPNTDTNSLWSTDGTTAGTHQVAALDHNLGFMHPLPDGRLLFSTVTFTNDNTDTFTTWVTDGTAGGTTRLDAGISGDPSGDSHAIGNQYFFLAFAADHNSFDLWRTSTTPGSTVRIGTVSNDAGLWGQTSMTVVDGQLAITVGNTTKLYNASARAGQTARPTTDAPAPSGEDPGELIGVTQNAIQKSSDGVLRIFGTNDGDTVQLYDQPGVDGRFIVNLNGMQRSFAMADISRIYIFGYGGDDAVAVKEKYGKFTVRSRIWAGDGDDQIYSGGARDTIFAGAGDDTVNGGNNNDSLSGDDGNDSIVSGNGNDTSTGGDGTDTVWGNKGNDCIGGGAGDNADHLDGGSGADVIFGSAVAQIFFNGNQSFDGDPLDDVLLG